ncbi:MAG: bifunctional oligoribonuclease/PAP phosphatase NrnA [Candidatus Berkelbacteria bacterium]|nr:bifunctional oligoribonuclease/PAP phosphatase NrnA [Candidatus Berkelbacteria bacterium]
MVKTFEKILAVFEKSERVLILLHLYPDGDTVASSLALATFLKRRGILADCAVRGEIPKPFHFLPGVDSIRHDFLLGDYDVVVAVDCGDAQRTGFPVRLEQICKSRTFINIDHHNKNNLHRIAKINLVDKGASAAAEIIWDFLKFAGAEIDSKMATYILSGIYFDTGGFQHSNVTTRTLEVASDCLRLGARISAITANINGTKTSSALKLWGMALKRMRISRSGIASSILTQEDLKVCRAKAEDASGVVNLISSVPQAKLAILFLENPDGKIKASLRTDSVKVDVAQFARLFGGGGHKKAAGFTIEGKLVEKTGKWGIAEG